MIGEDHECPICCDNKLKGALVDWYPCPCGGQLCPFCFDYIMNDTGLCPFCRRKYDADAENRIGEKYKPATLKKKEAEPIPVPTIFVLSQTMVEIVGIPVRIANATLLKRNEYLGQYGRIVKIACFSSDKNPFLKISSRCRTHHYRGEYGSSSGGYIYVEYATPEEAKSCIYALNDATIYDSHVTACLALTEQCSSFLQGKPCKNDNCMKLHENVDKGKCLAFSSEEVDGKCERLLSALRVSKPSSYESYPKRAFGVPIFPPPRLMPPNNGNKNFIVTSTVADYSDLPPLIKLATDRNIISLQCLPKNYTYPSCNLVDILGLDRGKGPSK